MHTQTPLQKLQKLIKDTPFAVLLIVFAAFLVVFGMLFWAITPRPVAFAYGGETCVREPTVAPALVEQHATSPYRIEFQDTVTLGGVPLVAWKTCFIPTLQPEKGEDTVQLVTKLVGSAVAGYTITVPEAPVAQTAALEGSTVAVAKPVSFELSTADTVHRYSLYVGEARSICSTKATEIVCDLARLNLTQGEEYDARLERQFATDLPEVIAQGTLVTLQPVRVTDTSVSQDETVYSKPKELSVSFDKSVSEATATLKAGDTVIETDTTLDTQQVKFTWQDDLPRQAEVRLTIDEVVAEDGSTLLEPYTLDFTTSGGPTVQAVSIGTITAPVAGTITVTLDQSVKNVAEALQKISVAGVNAQISLSGRTVSISYSTGLCQPFTIKIGAGLISEYDITNPQAWAYSSRTQCYSTSVIGTSEQGRAIIAYSFGSGSKTVLFTGALHGNEGNTKLLLDAWVNELERRATEIPSGTRVVVVPLVNPDGYALGTRYNARDVDLNRNFDTSDWKEDIQNIYGDPFPGGGGSAPMSEKETKAIATYTQQLAPRLTMSYHSVAGYAIANTCGDSSTLAAQYAQSTGYQNKTGVSGAFSYEITGTYDDWICERLGLPSVLVELATSWSAEFERNRAAMWLMVRS